MVSSEPDNSSATQPFLFELSIDQLRRAVIQSLGGGSVIWEDADSEVIVILDEIRLALRPGLILIDLPMMTDQTGRASLVIPLSIGTDAPTATLTALTESQPRGEASLASRWGRLAQDALWDAVLDAGQSALRAAETGAGLEVAGLYTGGESLTYLATRHVMAAEIAEYYRDVREQFGEKMPEFNPQPAPLPVQRPRIRFFQLINAETGQPIPNFSPLTDWALIDLSLLPTRKLSIRAQTEPEPTGSVTFSLSGSNHVQIENTSPYALFGNRGDRYTPWTPEVGQYTLTTTLYTGPNATGIIGSVIKLNFYIIDCGPTVGEGPKVTQFQLINCDTGRPIAGFEALQDGVQINLRQLPTRRLSMRILTDPEPVGSVVLGLDDNPRFRIEETAPYSLFGNQGDRYTPWTLGLGEHRVTATPYTGDKAQGAAGPATSITFTLTER
jgi:hypothetical protein